MDGDHTRDPETGEIDRAASLILEEFGTFAEVSSSGTGFKLIGEGHLPAGVRHKVNGWEAYDSGRFFALTGNLVPGIPTEVRPCQAELEHFAARYLTFGDEGEPGEEGIGGTVAPEWTVPLAERKVRALAYLRALPGAISGQAGSTATFVAAQVAVRGFVLPDDDALAVLKEAFNPRCEPPWTDRELLHKIKDVREKGKKAWGYVVGGTEAEPPAPIDESDPIGSRGFLTLAAAVALNTPRAPRSIGVTGIDRLLAGGLGKGESLVIGGGPGSCKTTILCRAAAVLSSPATALLVVAHDEFFARVARKVATGFSESYAELTADYPPVLARLEKKLSKRDVFLVFDDARSGRPIDKIVEAFSEIVPPDRDVYVLIDHIHAVELSTFEDRDNETTRVEKVAAFIGGMTKREWAVLSLSEVTKAALNPAVVREAPLAAFAGSRKIASRADAAIVAVQGEKPREIHLILAKTRFGTRGEALVELDPVNWTFRTIDEGVVEAQRKADAEAKRAASDAEDEAAVLGALRVRVAAGQDSSRSDLIDALSIRVSRVKKAVSRLLTAGVIREEDGPAKPTGGRRGTVLVEVERAA